LNGFTADGVALGSDFAVILRRRKCVGHVDQDLKLRLLASNLRWGRSAASLFALTQ
jgi:hypothetical protein